MSNLISFRDFSFTTPLFHISPETMPTAQSAQNAAEQASEKANELDLFLRAELATLRCEQRDAINQINTLREQIPASGQRNTVSDAEDSPRMEKVTREFLQGMNRKFGG